VRVFDAPTLFYDSLRQLTGIELHRSPDAAPLAAACPALGLSNKPILAPTDLSAVALNSDRVQIGENEMYEQALPVLASLQAAPLEEQLLQSTLWPERLKLYGHPNEVVCLAASTRHLASACKAPSASMAAILIWDIQTCRQQFGLPGHALTVTQLAYSHRGHRLLSVSRDRHFILWDATAAPYTALRCGAAHGRIIWTCAWTHDDRLFATGSRDEVLKVWREEDPTTALVTSKMHRSVTAVAFAPQLHKGSYLAAVGLESGAMSLHSLHLDPPALAPLYEISPTLSHSDAVRRLVFCDLPTPAAGFQLASCSDDHSLRILTLECPEDREGAV